jgi:hypothetical protein
MYVGRIFGLVLAAALAFSPGMALAESHAEEGAAKEAPSKGGTPGATKEWNQDEVKALSAELATAVGELRREVRRMPDPGVQAMQSNARLRFQEDTKRIEQNATSLSRDVGNGKTHDETAGRYYRLDSLVRSAAEEGRRLMFPEQVLAKIEVAGGLLDRLDAYYR